MGKLIKFEFRKIFKQTSLYVCMAITLLIECLMLILFKINSNVALPFQENVLEAINNSLITTLAPIIISLFACNDFSNETLKNIYSKGFSREKTYISKYIVSAVITLLCCAVILLVSVLLNVILGADTSVDDPLRFIVLLLTQFVLMLGLHGIFFGIASMIGSSGISIAVNIVALHMLVLLASLLINLLKIDFDLNAYWLESLLSEVSAMTAQNGDIIRSFIMSVVFIIVFNAAGYAVNKKRNL